MSDKKEEVPNPPSGSDDQKGWRKGRHRGAKTHVSGSRFKGRCEELSKHVYDCVDPKLSADMYKRTTREIIEYIGTNYKHAGDIKLTLEALKRPSLQIPPEPSATASRAQVLLWEKKLDELAKRDMALDANIQKAYSLIYGQCSDAICIKLESHPGHTEIAANLDAISLLKNIRSVMFQFEQSKYNSHALHEAIQRFYRFYQDATMTCDDYFKAFNNKVEVIEHCGGSIGVFDEEVKAALGDVSVDEATKEQQEVAKKKAQEKYLACAFILGADRSRYGRLVEDLQNHYTQGDNRYPRTREEALNVLVHWKYNPRNHTLRGGTSGGVAFANIGGNDTGERKRTPIEDIICFHCREKGHYASNCPLKQQGEEAGTTLLIQGESDFNEGHYMGFQFWQSDWKSKVPASWILLDSQSTVNVFCNPQLLTNIHDAGRTMCIKCNAGTTTTRKVGTLPGFGEVWFHPGGIANILSLAMVQTMFHVTFDSQTDNAFIVWKPDGSCRRFVQDESGLYYFDTNAEHGAALVTTVEGNKINHTPRAYEQATHMRKLQHIIGHPSVQTLKNLVAKNVIKNCPLSVRDVTVAESIYGPSLAGLKGKTVRRKSPIVAEMPLYLPQNIRDMYKHVTLCVDVMYVNQIPFLITISRHLKFGTVEALPSRTSKELLSAILRVTRIYRCGGFTVRRVHADGEFTKISDALAAHGIITNITGKDEHVPEVERYIRTVKERARAMFNNTPFTSMPHRMTIEMVHSSVFWLNAFPAENGISDYMSPRTILTGEQLDYHKHCRLEFGSHVQIHEEHSNGMEPRTTGAIALRPTGNSHGTHYFFTLSTGRRVARNHWTELPMPNDVILRIQMMSRDIGMDWAEGIDVDPNAPPYGINGDEPWIHDQGNITGHDQPPEGMDDQDIILLDHPEIPGVEDHEDDMNDLMDGLEPENDPQNENDDPQNDPQNENDDPQNENEPEIGDEIEIEPENDNGNENAHEQDNEHQHAVENEPPQMNENENDNIPGVAPNAEDNINEANSNNIPGVEPNADGNLNEIMDIKYGARTGRYNLRPRRPRDYRHMHVQLEATVMTQYSAKQGLRLFGDAGAEAIVTEMTQLHVRKVARPIMKSMLTQQEILDALSYLMFLKQKRDGKIKARGCADGRKQRIYKTKEETSSPTVSTEALMLTCVIDAQEGRYVVTCDVPGAFMQAKMNEKVIMRIEGELARLLVRVDKMYEQYLTKHNGKDVIYVILDRALYGTLQAAYLFWQDLSKYLESLGFEKNPYDWCMANKTIRGKQCTVVWHVDDLKISHESADVVEDVLSDLNRRYGKEAPLTVTRGNKHDYLGMTLDYSTKGKVRINMMNYVEEMLMDLPQDMNGEAITPATIHLFESNEDCQKLKPDEAQMFHHYVAKLLFLAKRGRPDILTAVAYLTTRVKGPDIDDYKKLGRVMKYLRGTRELTLTLEAESLNVVKWWVDASFAVHTNCRSHTGATMSLGKGSIYSGSTRQKINTKSSTEAELVGVDDALGQILWTREFLKAQGHAVSENMIHQDNMSAILLEKNGRRSSGKRTRHINIRYFFASDRIRSGEVTVKYCPTGQMLADFFTKPLQGRAFRNFRKLVMNSEEDIDVNHEDNNIRSDNDPNPDASWDHRSVLDGKSNELTSEETRDRWEP